MTPRPYRPSTDDEYFYLSTYDSELPDDDNREEIGTIPEGIHFVRNMSFETLHLVEVNSHIIANYRKDPYRFQVLKFLEPGSIYWGEIIFKYY